MWRVEWRIRTQNRDYELRWRGKTDFSRAYTYQLIINPFDIIHKIQLVHFSEKYPNYEEAKEFKV